MRDLIRAIDDKACFPCGSRLFSCLLPTSAGHIDHFAQPTIGIGLVIGLVQSAALETNSCHLRGFLAIPFGSNLTELPKCLLQLWLS